MSIKNISTDELRRMKDSEGLILQGCGGSFDEWVNGINDMLTEAGILQGSSRFENCMSFQHDNLTCLLFPFEEDIKLDMGKLAMWRLKTHGNFGGTWLSDYVPNRLGGFINDEVRQRPDCALVGQDGNIFNLTGLAARTLRRNGMSGEASEMCSRIYESDSYDKALCIIGEYVNITSTADGGRGLNRRDGNSSMTELVCLLAGLSLGGSISAILCLWHRVLRCEQELRRLTKNSKYE